MGKKSDDLSKEPLLYSEDQGDSSASSSSALPWYQTFKRENVVLGVYLILVILVGTGNRVSFKLMQYSIINYTYFVSQLTTFIYIPVNGAVLLLKMAFTNDITQEMRDFPKSKFFVMGLLDSLAGFLIVVGGAFVPGIMQNLLLQGVVVVTMAFSLLLLRPKGCDRCLLLKERLEKQKIPFTEIAGSVPCTAEKCFATISVDNMQMSSIQGDDGNNVEELVEYLDRRPDPKVVVTTSAQPWGIHLKSYYTVWQYVGAVIIMGGLVFSVWPALTTAACGEGNPAGPPFFDLLFFLATVPTALSAVYKEIAFRKADLDVWLVNFWVSVFQFFVGLLYAPLAAVLSGLAVKDIPQNLWRGFLCFLIGKNFIKNTYEPCPYGECERLSYPMCDFVCNVTDVSAIEESSCSGPLVDYFSVGAEEGTDGGYLDPWDYASVGLDCTSSHFVTCDPLINATDCLLYYCPSINLTETRIYGPNYDSVNGTESCFPYCSEYCQSPDSACIQCGPGGTGTCCDSCDGSYACLSEMSALGGVFLYMAFNIAYNTLLLLVIKYGSAALMYVASTVVLPLGSVAFTRKFLLGVHASEFTLYNGVGLVVVLIGLIIYRFVGKKKSGTPQQISADIVEGSINFSVVGRYYEPDLEVVEPKPRTGAQIRSKYYQTIGLGGGAGNNY